MTSRKYVKFKDNFSEENRIRESQRLLKKYPERTPVIVERSSNSTLPLLDENKFLVPTGMTIGQLMYVIRKRIKLEPEIAIFFFVANTLPPISELTNVCHKREKDLDGFLYIEYSGESTFGHC